VALSLSSNSCTHLPLLFPCFPVQFLTFRLCVLGRQASPPHGNSLRRELLFRAPFLFSSKPCPGFRRNIVFLHFFLSLAISHVEMGAKTPFSLFLSSVFVLFLALTIPKLTTGLKIFHPSPSPYPRTLFFTRRSIRLFFLFSAHVFPFLPNSVHTAEAKGEDFPFYLEPALSRDEESERATRFLPDTTFFYPSRFSSSETRLSKPTGIRACKIPPRPRLSSFLHPSVHHPSCGYGLIQRQLL